MEQFYLTLPSNTENIAGKINTASKYTVKLPETLNLQGEWECALSEIIYPFTFANIGAGHFVEIQFPQLPHDPSNFDYDYIHVDLISGTYTSAEDFIQWLSNEIDSAIKKHEKHKSMVGQIKINYDKITHRINVHVQQISGSFHLIMIIFKRKCQAECIEGRWDTPTEALWGRWKKEYDITIPRLLGFEQFVFPYPAQSKYPSFMQANYETMYVYADVIRPSVVGNILAPLLRTVKVDGSPGQIVDKIYNSPYYLPIQLNKIDEIEINIKNHKNELYNFLTGSLVIILHFRKVQNNLNL